ncbi:primosomal replication protein N [Uruburuella testudinis]|uniref:Primosomal replication protein N n=1 Tax=Uruburuella testudinis TaxID=1282863 RepID=A0ABY4DP93_9NEIS|nr:primosomal replication protein N [Uruburuella testudinis]UOO80882.1 primosomal replication protein N [Uruburuella testudinis]
MENLLTLAAQIAEIGSLRYTPAGIPVLDVVLKHESWQQENGQQCLVKFEMPAKIIGEEAVQWQHRKNIMVEVSGFLAQRSKRFPRPILRIQNIQEYKG